ncbi:MAG: ChaN family lipoprotein, partial [Kofleriaceae bacterium]
MSRFAGALALVTVQIALIGCAGKYPASGGTTPAKPGAEAAVGEGGLAAAALPYQILDGRTGRQVDEAAFWARLAAARAVCVGEEHPNPHHHWFQLRVVEQLAKLLPAPPRLALGLEMIQRPFQGVVDDYVAHRIDAATLRSRVGWEERWGYDWRLYGPTIDAVSAAGGEVIALNAPRELTKKISRQGLDALTPEERAQVPELVLDDAKHRAWFDALMNEMGGHAAHGTHAPSTPHTAPEAGAPAAPPMPSADRIYTVQVVWDETMAELGAKWLAAHPDGHLVILAGNGHCHDSAIVGRLARRGVSDAISVRPVIDRDGAVAEVLARPMNDYVVVLQIPTS